MQILDKWMACAIANANRPWHFPKTPTASMAAKNAYEHSGGCEIGRQPTTRTILGCRCFYTIKIASYSTG